MQQIYELLTAKHLFKGDTLNDHLKQMEMLLGPFPHSFISKARFREQCFTSDGTCFTIETFYALNKLLMIYNLRLRQGRHQVQRYHP